MLHLIKGLDTRNVTSSQSNMRNMPQNQCQVNKFQNNKLLENVEVQQVHEIKIYTCITITIHKLFAKIK